MINWHSIPFARLLIPFTIGIVVYNSSPGTLPYAAMLSILACLFLLFEKTLKIESKYKFKTWVSFSAILLFLTLGIIRMHFSQINCHPNHYSKIENLVSFKFEIQDVIEGKNHNTKLIAEIKTAFDSSNNKIVCKGLLLINLNTDSNTNKINVGEIYFAKLKLNKPEFSENPGSFDYKTYLKHKDITFTANANSHQIITTNECNGSIKRIAYQVRDNCLKTIKENIPNKKSYGISEALLLGYKSDLSEETNLIFSRTGTLHILAVSGMHAGLIFTLLNWLFGFLKKYRKGEILKTILILFFLWFYAIMSGLSASVIRAAVMFSLMSIGKLVNRENSPINSIFSSAFLMLIYDPNFIFDPGFQLSYAAVLGIVLCYSKIKTLYKNKSKTLRSILDLINISICAQLLTFPISIFYFNQFPTFFILTNLIVIPIYTLLIFLIISLFPLSLLPIISKLIGQSIDKIIYYNDLFMKWADQLPYAVIEKIKIDYFELFIIYTLTFIIITGFYNKSKKIVLQFLLVLTILKAYQYYNFTQIQNQRFICIMGFKNDDILVCVDGEKAFVYGDSLSLIKKSIKNDLNCFFTNYKIKSNYVIQENNSFVSTNFRSITRIGFQFFDRTVTKPTSGYLIRQNKTYFIVSGVQKNMTAIINIHPRNLIISHKMNNIKKIKNQNELFKRFDKKINILGKFNIICHF